MLAVANRYNRTVLYLLVLLGVPLLLAGIVTLRRRGRTPTYYEDLPNEDGPGMTDLVSRGGVGQMDYDENPHPAPGPRSPY